MNDMKQMCERRRTALGEGVVERRRRQPTSAHLRGVRAAPLQSSHAPDSCKHAPRRANKHASKPAEVSKQAATSETPAIGGHPVKGKKTEGVSLLENKRPRSYFPALFMCKTEPSTARGDLRLPFTPTHPPTGIMHPLQTPVTIRLNPQRPPAAEHPFKEPILGIHRYYI